jgi:restriction endonuclease S subunit
MAGVKITDLVTITEAATDDLLYIVDVSNTTQSPQGTSSQIELGNIVSSGTWTPVVSGESYSEIVTIQGANYSRVGTIVTCSLFIQLELDAAETIADFKISLPVASDFINSKDAFGIIAFNGDISEFIDWNLRADTATNKINIAVSSTTAGITYQYLSVMLQYEVL